MEAPRLKPLTQKNLEAAVAMAAHYRALNQPDEAESICRDVLGVAPTHEAALRTLGLALTDRLATDTAAFDEALATFARLPAEYDRVYFAGVAWERRGKAQLAVSAHDALHAYEQALDHFAKAESLAPAEKPEPLLRYNCCVRALTSNPELLRELDRRKQPTYDFGD